MSLHSLSRFTYQFSDNVSLYSSDYTSFNQWVAGPTQENKTARPQWTDQDDHYSTGSAVPTTPRVSFVYIQVWNLQPHLSALYNELF